MSDCDHFCHSDAVYSARMSGEMDLPILLGLQRVLTCMLGYISFTASRISTASGLSVY